MIITGTDFTGATAVDFGKTAATNVSVNAAGTQITATSPAEAVGTVDVKVVGPGGTSATSSADKFLYEPAVTAVSPISGPTTGGGTATITGTGFTGVTAVDFGTTPATNVVINSTGTQITATIPALPAGTVNVTVTGPDGTSSTSSADEFISLGVTGVTTTQPSGTYGAGTTISIAVTFSEAVNVTGGPQLALNAGGGAVADYVSGSGTATLNFTYAVAAGQTTYDLDYASTIALVVNGGTIADATGTAATLTLPATGTDGLATQNIVIVPVYDNFANGFNTLPWSLTDSGPSPAVWTTESSNVAPGSAYAAESGAIGASSSSTLSVTLTEPAGEFAFWRSVSAGSGVLTFSIDNVQAGQWSGTSAAVPWQQSFYYVTNGQHTYTWTYSQARRHHQRGRLPG